MQSSITVYPLANYTFGTKAVLKDLEPINPANQIEQLYKNFSIKGVQISVQGILIVHDHHHPNLLMIQNSSGQISLPLGALVTGEDEISGLKRILDLQLGSSNSCNWDVGETLSVLYRPNFEHYWV